MSSLWRTAQPWLVSSSILTHLHLFSRFSRPEFQNPNISMPLHSLLSWLRFKPKNLEIQYHMRELWSFPGKGRNLGRSLPQFQHIFTFSAVFVAPSFRIQTFLCHCASCSLVLRFKPKKTRKSDIVRGSYECFLVKGAVLVGPFLSSDISSRFQPFLLP
jgi:hypothetical protein